MIETEKNKIRKELDKSIFGAIDETKSKFVLVFSFWYVYFDQNSKDDEEKQKVYKNFCLLAAKYCVSTTDVHQSSWWKKVSMSLTKRVEKSEQRLSESVEENKSLKK